MGGFVYLDENGDTGFKFQQGSSRYFVVTMLITPDPIPLNSAIDDLRKHLHYHDRHEFKFTNSEPRVRKAILRVITRHDVLIRSLVVDKMQLSGQQLKQTQTFYNHLVQVLFSHDNGRLDGCKLILDQRQQGKRSKQTLATFLRRELNREGDGVRKIQDIRYHESHRDNLLQAVDMVSGAIYTHVTRANPEYMEIFQTKLDDLWLYSEA